MTFITPNKVLGHLDRLAAWQRGEKPAPVTVEWDLSNRCYLGCGYCHFAHTHTKGPWASKRRLLPTAWEGTGDLADVAIVKRALGDMAAAGVQGIVWSGGGEPTVHPQWLEVVDYAGQCGFKQGMYTAAGLLTQPAAAVLASLASWVVVSLDAADRESYRSEKGVDGFEKACQGARWLSQSRGASIGVSFLLHERNWPRAEEMLDLGRSLGATYVTFRPTIETTPDRASVCVGDRSWITAALPVLERLSLEPDVECQPSRFAAYRDWQGRSYDACYGVRVNATITPDGRVWLCPQRRGIVGSEIGDLRTESFAELWARHPGQWTDFTDCRVMCRLHLMNETLAHVFAPHQHEAFV